MNPKEKRLLLLDMIAFQQETNRVLLENICNLQIAIVFRRGAEILLLDMGLMRKIVRT